MEQTKPKFLSNVPIGADLFEGKSQEKIADVVKTVLTEEKGFKVIGIDGAWGTGKSNLIKILEKKLPEHRFFIYDVWGHQEDDQRKSILVELTDFISDENGVIKNKKKWQEKLLVLLSKRKTTTTFNLPYLSVGFIFSLFSIIYIPSVNALKDDLTDYFRIEKLFWKILFVTFPVIIVLGIYIYNLIKNWSVEKKKFWESFKISAQQTFQVYTNKQEQETKSEIISENEPTVREFLDWMKEIDTDLGDKKLLLVFDNFDRLPKKNIASVWSSIHTFFAEEPYKNIKVIIPFDRNHIKNAFKDLDGGGANQSYANDYINKTFDLVYRVSAPIMSDWKTFFRERWTEAFTTLNEAEYLKVEQIYEVYRPTITPREIIACINEIVSLKLLHQNIPDRYLAMFVLNKEVIVDNPLKAIADGEFLQGLSYLYLGNDDFQKYITALAYQIDADNALEIVYQKQLKDSLINNKPDNFKEISKTSVFGKIIYPVLSDLDNYENPILVLDEIDDDAEITQAEKEVIWNSIYLKIKDISLSLFEIKDYQKVLFKYLDDEQSIDWLKKILTTLRVSEDFEALKFSQIVDQLDEWIKEQNIEIDIFKQIGSLEEVIVGSDALIQLITQKQKQYSKYRITTEQKELNDYLISLDLDKFEKENYLSILNESFFLTEFISHLEKQIPENNGDASKLNIVYKALKKIAERPFAHRLNDATIYSLFSGLNEDDVFYADLVAMRIAKLSNYSSSYVVYFSNLMSTSNPALAESIAKEIQYYANYGQLYQGVIDFSDSPLYLEMFIELTTGEYGVSRANIKEMLIKFDTVVSVSGIDKTVLFNKLNEWKKDNIQLEDITTFPIELFETAKDVDNELSKHLLKLANEHFSNYDSNKWVLLFDDFKSKEYVLFKTIDFKEFNSFSIYGFKASLIKEINTGNFGDIDEWNYLLQAFEESENSLVNPLKDIRDALYNNGSIVTKKVFEFLFEPFLKYDILSDRITDTFRTLFKNEFLDNEDTINLMLDKSTQIKEMINQSPSASSDFKQGIRDRMESNHNIKSLADKLGIRPNKKSREERND